MNNDHAQDRYDPPSLGSDFERESFSEINPGVIFRLEGRSSSKQYRKVGETTAVDVSEQNQIEFESKTTVYVKS